jgi:hypothetical protein
LRPLALTGDGSGPREVAPSFRVSEEDGSALLVLRTRHAVQRLPGVPTLSAHAAGSPLSQTAARSSRRLARLSRAFAKDPPLTRTARPSRSREARSGGQLTLLSFPPLQRLRNRGSVGHGPTTPATVRPQRFARSRRFAPPETLRAYFIPVTLMGFGLQGFSLARSTAPLRNRSSLAVPPRAGPVKVGSEKRLQRFDLSASPFRRQVVEACPAADALLAFASLGLSIPPPWDRLPGPSSQRLRRRELRPAEVRPGVSVSGGLGVSPSRERRPFWGFSPRRESHTFECDPRFGGRFQLIHSPFAAGIHGTEHRSQNRRALRLLAPR